MKENLFVKQTCFSGLGFQPGADNRLANYEQVVGYFQKVAAAAPDRVKLVEAGKSTQGRTYQFALGSSADKLPRFGTIPGTRIHFGAGYSGNGVGPSWLGGQILASLALGAQDEWTALPLVDRRARRLPPEPFRYVGGRVVRWGTLASEEAIGAGRRPSAAARAAAAIPRLLRMPIGVR